MEVSEASIYSGVITAAGYGSAAIVSNVIVMASAAVGITGIIPLAVGATVSIAFSSIVREKASELYEKYAPKVKEVIQEAKQFVEDKWNAFTNWAGDIFRF